jgi:hypothetical protein
MNVIYQKLGVATVTYNESPKYILYNWEKNAVKLEDYKELHLKALDVIKQNKVYNLISDSSTVTDVPFNECLNWLSTELMPKLSAAGVTKLITIVPQTALSRIGTKSWQQKIMGIDMYDVKDRKDALSQLN